MTVIEFKAWLLGFERQLWGGRPSRRQWAEIRRHLAQLQPDPSSVILVTPNTELGHLGEMRVVALDNQVYEALAMHTVAAPTQKGRVNSGGKDPGGA